LMLRVDRVFQYLEIWRLVTFLIITPPFNPLFAFFYLYFLYFCGSALETEWGSFAFTLYYLVGALGTVLFSFVYALNYIPMAIGAFYLNISIFLALAALAPGHEIFIFPIPFPIKIKWIALFVWAKILYDFFRAPLFVKGSLLLAFANYLLFFAKSHVVNTLEAIERVRRRRRFRKMQELI